MGWVNIINVFSYKQLVSKLIKYIYILLTVHLKLLTFSKLTLYFEYFKGIQGNMCVIVKLDITAETTKILLWTPCQSELYCEYFTLNEA